MENEAKNWLEAGRVTEARRPENDRPELGGNGEGMNAQPGLHPNVLLVHWEIYARTQQWASAHTIAEAIMVAMPDQAIGWIYRSFSLHRMGRIAEAFDGLLGGARKFQSDWRIAFNLACYACQLGDVAGAWNWLDRAIELGEADVIKSAALDEPNLKPLWARLGEV